MEEKLVKVLLDQYREKGVDMYALLDDEFFKKLDLDQKVDLIKKYASHISSGTSRTLTKQDIRALILEAGFSGVITGVTAGLATRHAASFFKKGHMPIGIVAGGVALGAALAAGNVYLNSRKMIKERDDILKKIDQTSANPTDENALGVLTTRNNQLNPLIRSSIKSTATAKLGNSVKGVPGMITEQVEPMANYLSFKYHLNNPIHGGYDTDVTDSEFVHYYQQSERDVHNSFQNSMDNMKKTILGRN